MARRISATELQRSLLSLLDRVRHRHEEFLIVEDGQVVATLAPADPRPKATWGTLAEALEDYPWHDDAFASDLEEIQRTQPIAP